MLLRKRFTRKSICSPCAVSSVTGRKRSIKVILLRLYCNTLSQLLVLIILISSLIVPPALCKETEDSQAFIAGFNAYQQKNYVSSIEKMNEVLRKYPDTPLRDMALFWLSRSYYKVGNQQEAARYLSQFSKEYPDNPLKNTVEEELLTLTVRFEKGEKLPVGALPVKQPDRQASRKAEEAKKAAVAAEVARVAAAKAEQERIAREAAEQERAEKQKMAALKAEEAKQAAAIESERLAAAKAEQERIARETAERERAEQQKEAALKAEEAKQVVAAIEAVRVAAAKTEQERIAREAAERERERSSRKRRPSKLKRPNRSLPILSQHVLLRQRPSRNG